MQRAARIPDDVKLVVPAESRHAVREHGPTVAIFVGTTAVAALGVATTWSVVWLVIGSLCLAGVVLELLLVRAQVSFGPLLAADGEHVWVRTGGFFSPRSVRLDWPEVTVVTLHLWHGRRGVTARYLSFDLTDEASAALAADPRLARRARRLTRTFGSPLAVAEQKARVLDDALRYLRDLAPEDVRFTQKT
ncbi:hypothetical protein [Actinophytocola algeriensis]|uniref:PH (Pleckstrin Homology) domain-containing protein n=1 Tax=Actinophytocola algeriensis TaxID=1768010 RepID=A0A7W7VG17_9PSEU|nr:hypothetical protein [Actinophytocola algeriensis]MBB4908982.1 hypothetical protein [Actinophytocola algeriensis]MBE1474630.1 hypothetical protein [Actinophytocola algeriensis]